jgi:hypothetical protein
MTDMTIAKTILSQLGGNKFIAMTGAKNLGASENGLSMKIMRNAKKVTHVKITLNGKDLYDVEFIKINTRTLEMTVLSKAEDAYAEDLKGIFESSTGLYTSL